MSATRPIIEAASRSLSLLMQPGPTQVDPRVIRAMCVPPLHHLSPEFVALADDLCARLAEVYGTQGEVVILPSSGRGGIEAVLGSIDVAGRPALIVSNGTFGRMMAGIARGLGLDVVDIGRPAGVPFDPDEVRAELAAHRPALLAMVHSESSTGMLNELAGFGRMAHDAGALFLVDAVSSLGGAALAMDELEIDFCVSAPQKALGALSGLALVAVGPAGIDRLQRRSAPARSVYFDLRRWWDIWLPAERGGRRAAGIRRFPYSMPTHLVLALDAACELLHDETLPVRVRRHERAARAFRAGARELGFGFVCADEHASPTVTALRDVPGVSADELVRALGERHRISVAGAMDELPGAMVRVGHQAESARPAPLLGVLAACAEEIGAPASSMSFLGAWRSPDDD